MKCLIIAAGQGSRLRQRAESKPLALLHGVPLIDHVIKAAREGGVDEFFVVSGYKGPLLRTHLDRLAERDSIKIGHIVNERWREPNGVSVLAAADKIDEPFVLLMSDHLFDPTIVRELIARPVDDHTVVLATDSNLYNSLVDLNDVTRVRQEGGLIRDIGKGIDDYNAFDTGIFRCTPSLFEALETSLRRDLDSSLSGGIRVLAESSRACCHDIGDCFWLDVDDSRTYVKAEVALERVAASAVSPLYGEPSGGH